MGYHISSNTIAFITAFIIVYLFLLLRKAIRNRVDIYDLFMLSMVALIPALFVYFPELMGDLTAFTGVGYPFLLLFGFLFVVVFGFLYRLVERVNDLSLKNILLAQELALLSEKISRDDNIEAAPKSEDKKLN